MFDGNDFIDGLGLFANDDDDAAAGVGGGGGSNSSIEFRVVPSYDEKGKYDDYRSDRVHLCRYLVPWPIARFCTYNLGLLDCGIRVRPPNILRRLFGCRGRAPCSCLTFILLLATLVLAFLAWRAHSNLGAIIDSPCYVCNHKHVLRKLRRGHSRLTGKDHQAILPHMDRYAQYVHGVACALDDHAVTDLDAEWRANITGPYTQYARYRARVRPPLSEPREAEPEDWRNAIPRLWIVGVRGAGTTSLAHYLDAHPDIAVRYQIVTGASATHSDGEPAAPWDDHFFASVPGWKPWDLRAWLRRGWGEPTLADHQGLGKTRVEVGPDYLWRASSGAAGAVRRAIASADLDARARFVVILSDPIRLVREAHRRAVDTGTESRSTLAEVVAEELPLVAQCLWRGEASPEEQAERLVSGQCGGGEPGRVGPPYLWRGLLSPFLEHWIRTTTPGRYGQWYAIRAEDLLHDPNGTLNRMVRDFMGLATHDFGPAVERAWHPDPGPGRDLAPQTTWIQSWRAHLPRVEYLKQMRKRTSDALLDAAERAARSWVPGLDAGLKATEKLRRLHCRLSGFLDPQIRATQQCLGSSSAKKTKPVEDEEEEEDKGDAAAKAEEQALEALRDFYAPYQERLMYILDATDADRISQQHQQLTSDDKDTPDNTDGTDDPETLREFYLNPR